MAEKHIANKEGRGVAVSTTPDFCRVGKSVIPFDISRDLSNAVTHSSNVYARGEPVLTVTSRIKGVLGDNGSGVASQVSRGGGDVVITSGSPTVKTNGLLTAHHLSDCQMNVGSASNCIGKIQTDRGAPARRITNNRLPCHESPGTSPRLEELQQQAALIESSSPSALMEFMRPDEAEAMVQAGIDRIQSDAPGAHVAAGAARAILGFANRSAFGFAGLVKLVAEKGLSSPQIDGMRRQVDAEILAEHMRLGNCTDQRTFWEKLKDVAGEMAKPVADPLAQGETVQAATALVLEIASLGGPAFIKLGRVSKVTKAGKAAELSSEATKARQIPKASPQAATPKNVPALSMEATAGTPAKLPSGAAASAAAKVAGGTKAGPVATAVAPRNGVHVRADRFDNDVGRRLGSRFGPQASFKDGLSVRYGKKGSTRPDHYRPGRSVESKSYNLGSRHGRDRLVRNVTKQAIKRAKHLRRGTVQEIYIDVRGQRVDLRVKRELTERIARGSKGTIRPENITFFSYEWR